MSVQVQRLPSPTGVCEKIHGSVSSFFNSTRGFFFPHRGVLIKDYNPQTPLCLGVTM